MDWLAKIIMLVIGQISPELRAIICQSLNEWEAKAKETKSPWDDLIVGILKGIMQCP